MQSIHSSRKVQNSKLLGSSYVYPVILGVFVHGSSSACPLCGHPLELEDAFHFIQYCLSLSPFGSCDILASS